MAEAVIIPIARKIVANLVPQALENVGKLWGVKHEIEGLRDTISRLLRYAEEELYGQIPHVRDRVEKLKDACYEAQDVLEEINIEAIRRELRGHNEMIKEVRTFFSSSNQLAFQLKMRNKVRAARERIEAIKADNGFHLDERPVDLQVERERRKREETHPVVREVDIIGRDGDKERVRQFLMDSDEKEDVSILPIVGIGGQGKTALAQCVYNDVVVSDYFCLKMWVCVSNGFDLKKIVKDMIACAKQKEPTEVAMDQLQSELRAEIDGKRYLLVLDDLSNDELEKWLSLKTLLMGGARGSKILITTHIRLVAEITGTVPPHFLGALSESASLYLLMQMAGRKIEEIQDSDMLAIGKEIVKQCSGVPLVLRSVGSLLLFKETKSEWLHFKDHELSKVSRKGEAINNGRRFHLDERLVDSLVEREGRKREETHSFVREVDIKGRDGDKERVRQFLMDSDEKEDVSILPIVGIGGLGKTALAQCVYNDVTVSNYFCLKMWVCASKGFDVKKIVKDMIACAKKKEPTEFAMDRLQSELRAEIDGRRYLLVLDDLWNDELETWLSLKTLLMGGARGSKILITTHIRLVAEITGTVSPYFLGALSESASLDLLMQMAGQKIEETQDSDMLAIGKEIVRQCSGIPLVLRTVGSLLLFKKTKSEWLHFKDHELPKVSRKQEAINNGRRFHLDERPVDSQVEREGRKREETHSFVREVDIKGRDGDKERVRHFLMDSDENEDVSILPIVGIGGLGKTALAQCVYNDDMVSSHFHLKMWVCVSNDFDEKKIVKDMIACAKKKEPTEIAMEKLQNELVAEIVGKRYLLVLDDLWNDERERWLSLKNLLMEGAKGSKILITTRNRLVAKITGTVPPHILEALSESASLDLLMQMAGRKIEEIQDSEMLAIGKEIVRQCSGIPLVLRTVGSLLRFEKTKSEWLRFKDHELSEVSRRGDGIIPVLRLSYDHLPSYLKQCFAFCSLFPKDYEIKKQTLINLWVAEGFIQPSDGSQHLEDFAHRYFMDLLWGNFFQDFQKDSFTNKETCKMPALMHDLACSVARFECRSAGDGPNSILEGPRHISYRLASKLMCELPMKASSVRTILSVPTYRDMEQRKLTSEEDLCQLIQSFKKLRVFDLHAAIVKKVPRSICKLKHLTYLDLSHNNELKRLPNSITKLHNLQTLNLQGCSALEELPRDIRKLVNLRNLDIDHCHNLSYVPRGLEQLTCLHSLTRFILPKGKALAKNYCRLGGLNGLNNLCGSLSIENLGHSGDALQESRAANLIEKHSLESLTLRWHYLDVDDAEHLDGLTPPSNLQKLTIDGYEGKSFPRWMMVSLVDSLPNLVEVRLLRCGRIKHLPKLGQLPRLKSLELWGLTELENIESDQSTSFPSLLKLEIRYCKNLKKMPQTPQLEELNLREVNQEFFTQMIGLDKLKSLDISQMEFLDHLPEKCLQSLTSLGRLRISECPQLTSLSLSMQHLSNLMDLSLSNCEELDLSKDESGNILDLQGPEELRFVDILGVPKLASLPQWLLQGNNLEHLSIKKCLNLKALPEQIGNLQLLQKLEIIRCPSLTSLPSLPEGMKWLSSHTHLRIAGCPELEERCKEDTGEDWNKIAHIRNVSHKLEFNERHL